MEIGIMTALAVFIVSVVGIYLTKGVSVLSFMFQIVPMTFAALYIIIEFMTKINQGVIDGQLGYILMGTIIVIAVTIVNRSIQQESISHSYKESEF